VTAGLHGKVAVLDHSDGPTAVAIGEGLRAAGADVVALAGDITTATDAEPAWSALANVDVYVHTGTWSGVPAPRPMVGLSDADFASAFEQPVLGLLWSLQAAHAHLARPGGRVVVLVPTAAMAGAPGLAATAAAAEAHRLLAKSAARQWGEEGIAVNVVAADIAALAAGHPDLPSVALSPPALGPGAVGDLTAIARVVTWLASADSSVLTGATLSADGGIWMAP
jgi:3-oxoacyl-[acyl-carrier protein] reductase